MSTSIVTVEMDDSLTTVKEIFDNSHFHHLLVVEADTLIGVVSDRDLLKSLSPNIGTAAETDKDAATLNKRVHQIMSRNLITLKPDAKITDAVNALIKHNVSCIPIINDEKIPVGIVSWRDVLKTLKPN